MTIIYDPYRLESVETIEDDDTLPVEAYPQGQPCSARIERRLGWRRMTGDAPGHRPPRTEVSQASKDWWSWFTSLDEPVTTGQITFF